MTSQELLFILSGVKNQYILEAKDFWQKKEKKKPGSSDSHPAAEPLPFTSGERQHRCQTRESGKEKKKGWKKFFILSAAVGLLLATLAGSGFFTQWTNYFATFLVRTQEQDQYTQPVDTTVPSTQFQPETPELTQERDPEKICLRVQPTGVISSGDEDRYYTPKEQDIWFGAYEIAAASRIADEYWNPEDQSTGVWLRYQDEWWRFLKNGDILTLSNERIPASQCQELTALVEDALSVIGLPEPVRPEQIQSLRKATLDWNGIHTLTEPEKLSQLERMLSSSQELRGGANCWFTALLTLEREDGTVLTLSMATDSCGTWLSQGVFYEYSQGNESFYALFSAQADMTPSQMETATPPAEQEPDDEDLVRISDYIPSAILDLRYATENNFTGKTVYSFTDAYLRYGTVKKLQAVEEVLAPQGYSLVIWDTFRPVSAQQTLWDICPDPNYVSNPITGNRNHCRGNAIDLSIADSQGNLLEMPSEFDDLTVKADRNYSDCTPEAAANAQLLQDAMEAQGFTGYEKEWWHFSDSTSYPVEEAFLPLLPSQWQANCNEFITLRRKPDTSAEAICRISQGGELTKLADSGSFAYVEYQGKVGYVLQSYLKPVSQ